LYHLEEGNKISSRYWFLKFVEIMADMNFGACNYICTTLKKDIGKVVETGI
jgi:hypothetical protein